MSSKNCYDCKYAKIDIDEITCRIDGTPHIIYYPNRPCSEFKYNTEDTKDE